MDSDDSDDGPPLEGLNLLDQIAEIEVREVKDRLGLSMKVPKPKKIEPSKTNLLASQKPIAPRGLNTFVGDKIEEEKSDAKPPTSE